MAECTPTTDEVRERFIVGAINRAKATGFSVTLYIHNKARGDFDRWLAEVRREVWDEGAQAGLDAGLSIAEAVHANGGVLNLADVPHAPVNPYRAAVRPSGQEGS